MARRPRIDHPGGLHHVMNRGANRQATFLCDRDRVEFGRLLSEVHERFAVEVVAYCLMGNHYHLILHCPDAGLSNAMQLLGGVYTEHFNQRHGRDGALFRGRFRSIPITTTAYLLCAIRYVHRNCLDLPGVHDVAGYRWSSHRTYLGLRPQPSWMNTDAALHGFTEVGAFDAFVRGDDWFVSRDDCGEAEFEALMRLAIAIEFGDSDHDAQWVATTVHHLCEASGLLDDFGSVESRLPAARTSARRSALHRARRRAVDHPEIAAVLAMLDDALTSGRRAA